MLELILALLGAVPIALFFYSRFAAQGGHMDDDLRLTIEVARGDLVHRLESLPGPKHLLVEQCLLRPLDKVASMSLLAKHGCLRVFTIRNCIPD
ncbi:hypothetical protein PRIPAC_76597 [Pristionchus pacificus]|nr:hypothetical protein PRIPAC_76597 [Pristionchus pacificus]